MVVEAATQNVWTVIFINSFVHQGLATDVMDLSYHLERYARKEKKITVQLADARSS